MLQIVVSLQAKFQFQVFADYFQVFVDDFFHGIWTMIATTKNSFPEDKLNPALVFVLFTEKCFTSIVISWFYQLMCNLLYCIVSSYQFLHIVYININRLNVEFR